MTFRRTIRNTQPEMIQYARQMRREPTPAEAVLWEFLRGRKLGGLKFRRQHPLNAYILDFWCCECQMVIELDGGIRSDALVRERDRARQEHLEQHGFTVLRFRTEEVLENLPAVLNVIRRSAIPLQRTAL